jgi:hypothetical protein
MMPWSASDRKLTLTGRVGFFGGFFAMMLAFVFAGRYASF